MNSVSRILNSFCLLFEGMMKYDNGEMQVTVTTSEIAKEEECPIDRSEVVRSQSAKEFETNKQKMPPVKRKKLIKSIQKKRSRPKPQSKRDKRKAKTKNVRH